MFIDEVVIQVSSGRGGNGMVHFRREKYVSRGGPDGGDGGRGGDVILEVNQGMNTLYPYRFVKDYSADDGKHGGPKKQTGRSASPLVLKVPPGTIIYDDETDQVLGDLVENGQQLIICKGGRGGRGNVHFKNSRRQAPQIAEKGEPGEEKTLRLELKLIADLGLIGVPNAGKSSFLSAMTNAKPKIANYPFTTLEPNLGVVQLDLDTTVVLADIPGLIEGAHAGVGLGHDFLKHVQRTKVLIHVLDGLSENPLLDFNQINNELSLFDPMLSKKPQIIAFNKMDLPDVQEKWTRMEKELSDLSENVYAISAATGENLKAVVWKAYNLLQEIPDQEVEESLPVYTMEVDPKDYSIEIEEDGFRIFSPTVEKAAEMTYWEYPASVRRFQKLLISLGIEQALRDKGVEEGDTVYIGDFALDWQD